MTVYTVVDLQLRVTHGGIQRHVTVGDDAWDTFPVQELPKGYSLKDIGGTRAGDLKDADLDLIRKLLLSKDQWKQLRDLAKGRHVRLSLRMDEDLYEIPWESAVVNGLGTREVSVVRQHDRRHCDLMLGHPPIVRFIHAVTKSEAKARDDALNELRRTLVRTGKAAKLDNWMSAFAPEKAADVPPADLVHFTGHGDEHGDGLRVFKRMHSTQRDSIGAAKFTQFISVARASIVVLAACNTARKPWSLAASILGSETALAVVAMAGEISEEYAAKFCIEFYERLLRGGSLDDAVTAGRRVLPSASSWIPQLHLNVLGDTTLWVPPAVASATPVAQEADAPLAENPVTPEASPLGVVAVGDDLWGINLDGGRIGAYLFDGEWDSGAPTSPASLAISADGRVAVALATNTLDIAWLSPVDRELSVVRPAWSQDLQLPEQLRGTTTSVLAVSIVHGARIRIVIAAPTGTWWVLVSAQGWSAPHLLDREVAAAALDVLPNPVLAVAGRMRTGGGRSTVFPGGQNAVAIDLATNGPELAVRLDHVGGTMAAFHRPDRVSKWIRATPTDAHPPGRALRVAAVRQLARGHRPDECLVVDVNGEARLVGIVTNPSVAGTGSLG